MIPYSHQLVKWLVLNQLECNRLNQARYGAIIIHTDILLDFNDPIFTDLPFKFQHEFVPDPANAYRKYDMKQVLDLLPKFADSYKGQTSETTANAVISHIYSDPNTTIVPDLVETFMERCYEQQYTGRDI